MGGNPMSAFDPKRTSADCAVTACLSPCIVGSSCARNTVAADNHQEVDALIPNFPSFAFEIEGSLALAGQEQDGEGNGGDRVSDGSKIEGVHLGQRRRHHREHAAP